MKFVCVCLWVCERDTGREQKVYTSTRLAELNIRWKGYNVGPALEHILWQRILSAIRAMLQSPHSSLLGYSLLTKNEINYLQLHKPDCLWRIFSFGSNSRKRTGTVVSFHSTVWIQSYIPSALMKFGTRFDIISCCESLKMKILACSLMWAVHRICVVRQFCLISRERATRSPIPV